MNEREKLTENFYRDEFACKCGCGFDDIDMEVVLLCQAGRDHFGVPGTINSGCRCPTHNKAEGGGENSQHLYGRAADVDYEGVHGHTMYEFFDALGVDGLGKYETFAHVDVRGWRARW